MCLGCLVYVEKRGRYWRKDDDVSNRRVGGGGRCKWPLYIYKAGGELGFRRSGQGRERRSIIMFRKSSREVW